MTEAIKSGDTIAVDYTGKLENGDVFDTSEGKTPLTFTVGAGMLIKGFDDAVMGMKKGESKTVTIPPEEGYGPRHEDAIVEIPRAQCRGYSRLEKLVTLWPSLINLLIRAIPIKPPPPVTSTFITST